MDMSQILGLLQMAWDADDGGGGGGDGNAPADGPDPPIPHVHRSGPRPATLDPFAPGNLTNAALLADTAMLAPVSAPDDFVAPPPPGGRAAAAAAGSEAASADQHDAVDALASVDPAEAELQALRARMLARSQPQSNRAPSIGPPPRSRAHCPP